MKQRKPCLIQDLHLHPPPLILKTDFTFNLYEREATFLGKPITFKYQFAKPGGITITLLITLNTFTRHQIRSVSVLPNQFYVPQQFFGQKVFSSQESTLRFL